MADIWGTSTSDILDGTTADDVIQALGGSDTLNGGEGNDTLYDGSTWSPFGTPDDDILNGGSGNDVLDTDGGFDILNGGDGNDSFDIADYWDLQGITNDGVHGIYDGGDGTDTLYVWNTADISAVSLSNIEILETSAGQFVNQVVTATAAQFESFEVIRDRDSGSAVQLALKSVGANTVLDLSDELNFGGTPRNVVITGSNDNESITTGDGNDTIYGGGGNDTLRGGAGNDLLDGGLGKDVMVGGLGNDTYIVDDVKDVVIEKWLAGTDTVNTSLTKYTLGSNVENLVYVGTSAFTGMGNSLSNTISGGSGNDTLKGGGGDDFLIGGVGKDLLTGDAGHDQFVFHDLTESAVGVSRDIIKDFSVVDDLIDLSAIDANSNSDGNQSFVFVGSSAFANAGDLRFSGGILLGDVNGDGIADFEIAVSRVSILHVDDFIL